MNHLATSAASPSNGHPVIEYVALPENQLWWCNSHNRRATHMCHNSWNGSRVTCPPRSSGIMIPCECVDVTNDLEIEGC